MLLLPVLWLLPLLLLVPYGYSRRISTATGRSGTAGTVQCPQHCSGAHGEILCNSGQAIGIRPAEGAWSAPDPSPLTSMPVHGQRWEHRLFYFCNWRLQGWGHVSVLSFAALLPPPSYCFPRVRRLPPFLQYNAALGFRVLTPDLTRIINHLS